jgi:hypothetical protein
MTVMKYLLNITLLCSLNTALASDPRPAVESGAARDPGIIKRLDALEREVSSLKKSLAHIERTQLKCQAVDIDFDSNHPQSQWSNGCFFAPVTEQQGNMYGAATIPFGDIHLPADASVEAIIVQRGFIGETPRATNVLTSTMGANIVVALHVTQNGRAQLRIRVYVLYSGTTEDSHKNVK